MLGDIVFGSRQEIALGHRLNKLFDSLLVVVFGQLPAHSALDTAQRGANILALEFSFFSFFQEIERFDVKLAQQRRFPGIPDLGADGFDVGKGQQVEHLQVIDAAHRLGEIEDRLFIFQIASKRRVGH